MITEYMSNCIICGQPNIDIHHCFGGKNRKLCDDDRILLPLCRNHHTGNMSVHKNKEMMVMSKIIGQLAWEKNYIEKYQAPSELARTEFRRRYGVSYL